MIKGIQLGFAIMVGFVSLQGSTQAAPKPQLPKQYAIHPHEDIRDTARMYLENQIPIPARGKREVSVGRLDSRLALKPCEQQLKAFLPHGGAAHKTSIVGIQCDGANRWTLYVPVKVALWKPVVVPSRPLGRGIQITPQDVTIALRQVNRLSRGYHEDPDRVIGKVAKYYLRPGIAIGPRHLSQPKLVRRGERVTLHAKSGIIHVKTVGLAMKDGGLGDLIYIRNPSSKRVVEARVIALGEAEVNA